MSPLDPLAHSERFNAAVGWLLATTALGVAAWQVASGAVLWGLTSLVVVVTVALPAAVRRDWTMVPPWPLVLVAGAAIIVGGAGYRPEAAGYVAVAALAVLAAVELDAFTGVAMSRRFAVTFAVLSTLAFQGPWIVAQYASDRWFGTAFIGSQVELQVDIVLVTVIGLAMGVAAELYFARVRPVYAPERATGSGGDR